METALPGTGTRVLRLDYISPDVLSGSMSEDDPLKGEQY